MRRSGRTPVGGVRFAADAEQDDSGAIAITLGDAAAVGAPLEQLLAAAAGVGGSNGTPGAAPGNAPRVSPSRGATPLPAEIDEREGGGDGRRRGGSGTGVGLHMGGLQLLHDTQQDEMSHDEGGYGGHSRGDSDADGPLDGAGGGISVGGGLDHVDVDGVRTSARRQPMGDGFHSGDEERGPDAAVLATGGSHGGGGGGVSGGGAGGGPGGGGGGGAGRRHHRALSGKPGKSGKSGKQSVMRTWLRIERNGETSLLQVGAEGSGGEGGEGARGWCSWCRCSRVRGTS